jgi:putative ABC transport system substrate-binding protein
MIMRRREFVIALGTAVAAWPASLRAQQRPIRVGALHPFPVPHPWVDGLRRGLRDLGYVEGRTVFVDERGAGGRDEQLDDLAAKLVDDKVDVLVVMTGPALLASRKATSTIPIVMSVSSDGAGAPGIASLSRPGGNVTGLTLMGPDLAGLRLSMLKEAVPSASRIGVLYNPAERPSAEELRQTEIAAKKLGVIVQPIEARSADALERTLSAAKDAGADALITFAHGFALRHRIRIAELALQQRIPAMYGWREFAEAGGLLVYGPNVADSLYRAASFVDRIAKGAKPAEMPVEQPTKFELVINLKVAKALGVEIPPGLLLRADKLIE